MDDEEYARQLFTILTRPLDPDDSVDDYVTGPDRIDRYDGFGTEVQVTSVAVVPGEHGDQLDVGFVLKVPDGVDVPPEGSVLLPFAATWREAQGLLSPAAHAPIVASGVMSGVTSHVAAHRNAPSPQRVLPDRAAQRELLLELLRRQGKMTEVSPGRFDVRREPDEPAVTVVLSPDEWERVLHRHGAPRRDTFDFYDELFDARHEDETFIVYWREDLTGSVREELPPVHGALREMLKIQAARDRGEDPYAGGAWFAYTPNAEER